MRPGHPDRQGGFTIIELLVVISIVALLVSLLLPSLKKAKQAAIRVKSASGLHQLAVAYAVYANNWRGYLPANMTYPTDDIVWLSTTLRDEFTLRMRLARELFDCPAVNVAPRTSLEWVGWAPGGYEPSWTQPFPGGGGPIVPTSYAIYAGRVAGYPYAGLNATSIPLKIDDHKRVLGGSTLTPWLMCYVLNHPSLSWIPGPAWGDDSSMHGNTGLNAVLPDASVIFKRYTGPPLVLATGGDPNIVKFINILGSMYIGY